MLSLQQVTPKHNDHVAVIVVQQHCLDHPPSLVVHGGLPDLLESVQYAVMSTSVTPF